MLLLSLLLYSIPYSYENFRVAVEFRDNLPSLEMLKIKLLEEANERGNREYCIQTRSEIFIADIGRVIVQFLNQKDLF